jgi:Leucine-rich repeat (LRR) protein
MDSFQYLKNLKRLQLQRNCIIDIVPIKKASQLEFLSLQNNPITNFDALAHLPDTKIELSFDQKYDLKKLQDKNINVDIAFTNTYYNYDETFFQNN